MTAKVVRSISQWQEIRRSIAHARGIGFVPTMGALHAGHGSLIERSVRENEITVASIFVNPTQFNSADDLKNYPKTFEQDLELLSRLGTDYLLSPEFPDLYPDRYRYVVTERSESALLCGAHRPGHFDGVLSVVLKLLNIVNPDRAYFGEKDYQQLKLVQGMVGAFFLPTEIIPCPIVREKDGLAMSSRNSRLSPQEREIAPALYQILKTSRTPAAALERLREAGFAPDYVEDWEGRRLAAAYLGQVRLIDNLPLGDIHPESL